MKQFFQSVAAAGMIAAAMGAPAWADVVLSGPDSNDGVYSTATLAADATAGDTVSSGGLTGISVWGLLGGANASTPASPVYGGISTSTPAGDNGKNAILRYYLLGTGANGQQSVVSLGEVDPNFGGGSSNQSFIAFGNTSGGMLATPSLIVPGQPGRDINNLTSLQILAVPALPSGAGGVSTAVQLSGNVASPGAYTQALLQSSFTPVHKVVSGDTYTGVPLWTFLDPTAASSTNQIVITQATDGYEVVLALAELDPSLGGNLDDLLPYADTGTNFPGDGVARTVFPTDNAHGRWESNLNAVAVTDVPEPGTLALLATALAGVTVGRIRKRWSMSGA